MGMAQLMTMIGTGGCGKFHLAVQVATDLLDAFSDGVGLIELASLSAARPFLDRAIAAQADLAVPDQAAPAVAQIYRRLDAMPPAIQLAAARVRTTILL